MSLFWVFLVAALGGGVGAVIGLILYSVIRVSGTIARAEDAYQEGYAAARAGERQ